MNRKLVTIGLVLLSVSLGYALCYTVQPFFNKLAISDDAKTQALRVSVTVVSGSYTFNFSLDDPLTKILFWQGVGLMLDVAGHPSVDWEISLSHEDFPYEGSGDYTDVILKMAKLSASGTVQFEVACLGAYTKRVYYNGVLKLDTSTGTRWATWSA